MINTMKRNCLINKSVVGLGVLCFVLSFSACKSGKQVAKPIVEKPRLELDYLTKVANNTPEIKAFSSKMKLTITSKGKEMSVNGTLRMKKDEVIQLSLTPFLGIEVGKIEITPDKVLILDRINKQYVDEPIAELKKMTNTDMDFYTLQALFTNALFLPGTKQVTNDDLSDFVVRPLPNGNLTAIQRKMKEYIYSFSTTTNTGQLVESEISTTSSPYKLTWKYTDFQSFGSKNFPAQMEIIFAGGTKPLNAQIALSKWTASGDWESHTTVSSKYKKMELEDLFKVLLGL